MSDWNTQIIEEFRTNHGAVGGAFEGHPMLLLHHKGRKSGKEMVNPLVYLPDGDDPDRMYVFASMGGAPQHPQWYRNVVAAGEAEIEVGDETVRVKAEEVTGEDRDRIYSEQVRRMPGFGEYEEKTKGIRTIPVVALTRV
jgi:deazaflavin-dependent oxidoreductase (nitroreductase family)